MFRTVPLSTNRSFSLYTHSNGICHTGFAGSILILHAPPGQPPTEIKDTDQDSWRSRRIIIDHISSETSCSGGIKWVGKYFQVLYVVDRSEIVIGYESYENKRSVSELRTKHLPRSTVTLRLRAAKGVGFAIVTQETWQNYGLATVETTTVSKDETRYDI